MMKLKIIGKKGSNACKAIIKEAGISRYAGSKYKTDALVNYGLTGERLRQYYRKFPSARKIPTINKKIGHSKLRVINIAKNIGILTPDSKLALSKSDKKKDWIEKRFNSQGGYGICAARGKTALKGKYYQKFIDNRLYELRIHAFKWLDTKDYRIQKRLGDKDEIAWNFNQGGRFITVHNHNTYDVFKNAKEISNRILDALNMAFGAADFVVDDKHRLYFIEVNSAPGFSGLSDSIYIDAFKKLRELSKSKILKYT
jgi:glutathione synthase/RimK-type ligase-like ATP-grasp enzyme